MQITLDTQLQNVLALHIRKNNRNFTHDFAKAGRLQFCGILGLPSLIQSWYCSNNYVYNLVMSLWHHAVLACAIKSCDKYELKHLRHNSTLGRKPLLLSIRF